MSGERAAGPDVTEPVTEDPRPEGLRPARSLVLVNTGDGKGKSTAAFGVVMRSVARGWRVAVIQFLKSGKWHVGEEDTAKRLGVDWWAIGEGFSWESDDLSRDEAVAREAWRHAAAVIAAGDHQLVILDEVTYPINWGWIDGREVTDAIHDRPRQVNIVATGRDAPEALRAVADTVTEMANAKHAFDTGIGAMRGIEF